MLSQWQQYWLAKPSDFVWRSTYSLGGSNLKLSNRQYSQKLCASTAQSEFMYAQVAQWKSWYSREPIAATPPHENVMRAPRTRARSCSDFKATASWFVLIGRVSWLTRPPANELETDWNGLNQNRTEQNGLAYQRIGRERGSGAAKLLPFIILWFQLVLNEKELPLTVTIVVMRIRILIDLGDSFLWSKIENQTSSLGYLWNPQIMCLIW